MKTILNILILLFFIKGFSQVGINTSSPEAQLDIKASNTATPSATDGLLIPRVNAFPATNPTAAQQGMMVFLTTTSGTNLPGFYYWDNATTSWIGLFSTANGQKDWYKAGTTTPATAITEDIYRSANVGIGLTNPLSKLHIKGNSSGMTPNPLALATLESDNFSFLNLLSTSESGILFGRGTTATDGAIIYNTNGMLFRTNGNVNRMLISDAGNVSLGNFLPVYPLHFPASVGDKISLFGSSSAHYGFGIQASLLQMHTAGSADDIAFGYGSSASFTENVRFKGNGNVGIGTSNPTVPLHFASVLGDKVSLWGTGTNYYGFGVQNTLLQIHSDFDFSDIAFGYGSSGAFTENVRFTGDGFVGIGNSSPTVPLHFASTLGNKIALWGAGSSNYGFSVQALALQLHTSNSNGDIVFGYGPTASLTETMRVTGVGNVGIGTSTPSVPLHFATSLGDKISLYGSGPFHYGLGVQGNLFQIHSDIVGSDIAFGYGSSGAFNENVRIRGNGNVGIGLTVPEHPLQFKAALGDKISLYGGAGNHYGFGVQHNLLQIHSDLVGSDIVFGFGSSTSLTETMRIKGTGEVGIGTSTPTAELEVNGFTKMGGSTAPAIKMIKLTGTTSNTQSGFVQVVHGLTSSKILSVSVLVEYSSGNSVPPSYTGSAGYEYDYYVSATSVVVWNKNANSANILSKPIRILVTYEQ